MTLRIFGIENDLHTMRCSYNLLVLALCFLLFKLCVSVCAGRMRSWRSSWRNMWGRYRCWREKEAKAMTVKCKHTHTHTRVRALSVHHYELKLDFVSASQSIYFALKQQRTWMQTAKNKVIGFLSYARSVLVLFSGALMTTLYFYSTRPCQTERAGFPLSPAHFHLSRVLVFEKIRYLWLCFCVAEGC